jgi:hypothetical protein
MNSRRLIFLLVACFGLNAQAARVVVNGDENTLLSSGFNSAGATNFNRYVSNLKTFLDSPTKPGCSFLMVSSLYSAAEFTAAMSATPACTVTVNNSASAFTPGNLQNFDAVFLSGVIPGVATGADVAAVLTPYIAAGGNVYIGTGAGTVGNFPGAAFGTSGGVAEANYWNPTLNPLGINLDVTYLSFNGNDAVTGTHPILAGVTQLFQSIPSRIFVMNTSLGSQLIENIDAGEGGQFGIVAVFEALPPPDVVTESLPVPTLNESLLVMMGVLIAAVAFCVRRRA